VVVAEVVVKVEVAVVEEEEIKQAISYCKRIIFADAG